MARRILSLPAFLLVLFCGAWLCGAPLHAAGAAAPSAGPALWEVSGGKAKMVLFGSFHVLKKGADWLTPAIDNAFSAASTLVVEIDVASYDPAELGRTTAGYALLPKGETLDRVLDAATYANVVAHAEALGIDPKGLSMLRPWFVGLTLTQAKLAAEGYEAAQGVDATLIARAKKKGLKILSLESLTQQMSVLATPPEGDINAYMTSYLDDIDKAHEEFAKIDTLWRSGDAAGLETALKEEKARDPAAFKTVYDDRNRAWLPYFKQLLEGEGRYFVVVGAGHLVGDTGMVALLTAAGYTVKRL
jgi:uncharacterized protein YbaP (TraB family)